MYRSGLCAGTLSKWVDPETICMTVFSQSKVRFAAKGSYLPRSRGHICLGAAAAPYLPPTCTGGPRPPDLYLAVFSCSS